MTTIFLVRHGEIPSSKPRRFIGQQNLPLTATGRKQMTEVSDLLTSRSIDRVVSSPLSRCMESAQILCNRLGGNPEEQHELMEIDLGGWDGLTVAEVEKRYPGQYEARGRDIAHFRPEGGESFQDLLNRVWPFFDKLSSIDDQRIAIVAHAGVNRVLLCRILGMDLTNLFLLDQHYGCVNTLYRDNRGFRLHSLNYLPGLDFI